MVYAILSKGVVVNLIVADEDFVAEQIKKGSIEEAIAHDQDKTKIYIGDTHVGDGVFERGNPPKEEMGTAAVIAEIKDKIAALEAKIP